jgi:hypothetical protein
VEEDRNTKALVVLGHSAPAAVAGSAYQGRDMVR